MYTCLRACAAGEMTAEMEKPPQRDSQLSILDGRRRHRLFTVRPLSRLLLEVSDCAPWLAWLDGDWDLPAPHACSGYVTRSLRSARRTARPAQNVALRRGQASVGGAIHSAGTVQLINVELVGAAVLMMRRA
eukprot:COSAG01_NODE_22879_length_837_cov_1.018970_1_plen_131_part_10